MSAKGGGDTDLITSSSFSRTQFEVEHFIDRSSDSSNCEVRVELENHVMLTWSLEQVNIPHNIWALGLLITTSRSGYNQMGIGCWIGYALGHRCLLIRIVFVATVVLVTARHA